jgi:hypothetical protein
MIILFVLKSLKSFYHTSDKIERATQGHDWPTDTRCPGRWSS